MGFFDVLGSKLILDTMHYSGWAKNLRVEMATKPIINIPLRKKTRLETGPKPKLSVSSQQNKVVETNNTNIVIKKFIYTYF